MNAQLKKLKSEFERKKREFYALQNKISDKEDELAMPGLKEKLEGKYFRYLNNTGGDEKWYVYFHCREVISASRGIIDSFEVSPTACEFVIGKSSGFIICNEEISELEYKKAAIDFVKVAQKLL